MARVCEFSNRGPMSGNLISHSHMRTRTRQLPNLKNKRYLIEELGQTLNLKLTTRSIRTIDKLGGISLALLKAKDQLLSPRLLRAKKALLKKKNV